MEDLRFGPGDILEGDYWPEPVRVLTVNQVGNLTRLEVVGTESGRFYGETWLGRSDLASLKVQAPQGFTFSGDGEAAFLALEARRIRLAHLFDPLQAVHTSQVDPLPHQIDAVYHHMLRQARLRFLLADDPGAGKTIMAGLLLKELKYRSLVERTLIVVPGHLIDQWLREMCERFGERFRVVDRAALKGSWRENPWRSYPQLITSMDFAKQDDILASLGEVDWDLVIVDEAHKLSAWRYGDKTKKTQRYRLGEVLSKTSRFLLFLTATPHRGDPENFRLLLELLEPGMYASVDILSEASRRGENILFLRRLKEDLKT
ncbi:MAG TPA: DEAD/DEAH box helicase, partial [Candidatus Acetothermia bacterium]|nr:DEAD/DEAH box helicase [Candidatus Acetothermia bacterium]